MSVVVDASVAVAWFSEEARSGEARRLAASPLPLIAPAFLLLEVAHVFTRRLRGGTVARGVTGLLMAELMRMPGLSLVGTERLIEQAVAITERTGHPVCDGLYLALARRAEARLATFDTGLATAAGQLSIPLWSPDETA
jgi:predicted nucleic acid-binding protein